jgi:RNA polymerase sigma-70 factor (family 1)
MTALPEFLLAPLFGDDGRDALSRQSVDAQRKTESSSTTGVERTDVDRALLARMQHDDEAAFTELFDVYWQPLCAFAARVVLSHDLARDVVQETLVRFWERRAELHAGTLVRAYLYRAVRNHALHAAEHARVVQTTETFFTTLGTSPAMSAAPLSAEAEMARQELAIVLDDALNVLPPRTRQVALLKWNDGLSRTEIAHVIGVSPFTVDKQLGVAVRAMRAALTTFMGEPA